MPKAKIALIGCGTVSRNWHLPTHFELAKKGATYFVALCDSDESIAAEMGKTYGVPHYTDAEQMLDRHPDIDVVDICTGDYNHHIVAQMVAERKKHFMVEKPMALTLPCCDAIINAAKSNGVHYEVAENYLRMPADRMILKLIDEGILGDILRVHFIEPFRQNPFTPDVGRPQGFLRPVSNFGSHSGICIDMGAHRMSQLRLYAKSEPTKIAALTKKFVPNDERPFEDWGHAIIEFESGGVGVYETSLYGESTVKYRQITGTKGMIMNSDYRFPETVPLRVMVDGEMQDLPMTRESHTVDGKEVLVRLVTHTDPEIVYENPLKDFAIDDWNLGFADEIMSIARAATNDIEPEYTISGRKDVEMCIALYESSLKGMMPVELPIKELTQYEQMIHEDYKANFGHPPV